MFREWFDKAAAATDWPVIGLIVFVGLFLLVVVGVIAGRRDRERIDHMATLPLADDAESASTERGTRE